jgi:hypothetical protein
MEMPDGEATGVERRADHCECGEREREREREREMTVSYSHKLARCRLSLE